MISNLQKSTMKRFAGKEPFDAVINQCNERLLWSMDLGS